MRLSSSLPMIDLHLTQCSPLRTTSYAQSKSRRTKIKVFAESSETCQDQNDILQCKLILSDQIECRKRVRWLCSHYQGTLDEGSTILMPKREDPFYRGSHVRVRCDMPHLYAHCTQQYLGTLRLTIVESLLQVGRSDQSGVVDNEVPSTYL